jgi:hypothetical protein
MTNSEILAQVLHGEFKKDSSWQWLKSYTANKEVFVHLMNLAREDERAKLADEIESLKLEIYDLNYSSQMNETD